MENQNAAAAKNRHGSKKQNFWKEVFRRLKKNSSAMIALYIILFFLAVALAAGVIAPYSEVIKQNVPNRLQPPSASHWFGTDDFGRGSWTCSPACRLFCCLCALWQRWEPTCRIC